jgi:hypothetical protein
MGEEGNWFLRYGRPLETCYKFLSQKVSSDKIVGKKTLFMTVLSFICLPTFFSAGNKLNWEEQSN